jgi:hypothetical protein
MSDQIQDTQKAIIPVDEVQVLGPEEIHQEFDNMAKMIDAAVPSDVDHASMREALTAVAEMVDVLVNVMARSGIG